MLPRELVSGSPFRDRREAGRALARRLREELDPGPAVVLALPRGGVPVGYEIARALGAPLDVFLVRKLGVPWQPELAMGAIASGGVRVLNDDVVRSLGVNPAVIDAVAEQEAQELARRERAYRGDRPPPPVAGRTVILVDDGLATGATMRAAARAARALGPRRLVVAVPVGAAETCRELRADADLVVCLSTPSPFYAVGQGYVDFSQTEDAEVQELLRAASALSGPAPSREALS
jgi:predicted phosphoribosyltransferase